MLDIITANPALWMDGWMDGRTDGWMDGWISRDRKIIQRCIFSNLWTIWTRSKALFILKHSFVRLVTQQL